MKAGNFFLFQPTDLFKEVIVSSYHNMCIMHDGLSWHILGHERVRNLKQNFSTDNKTGLITAAEYNS